jgi:hypothetical protein
VGDGHHVTCIMWRVTCARWQWRNVGFAVEGSTVWLGPVVSPGSVCRRAPSPAFPRTCTRTEGTAPPANTHTCTHARSCCYCSSVAHYSSLIAIHRLLLFPFSSWEMREMFPLCAPNYSVRLLGNSLVFICIAIDHPLLCFASSGKKRLTLISRNVFFLVAELCF